MLPPAAQAFRCSPQHIRFQVRSQLNRTNRLPRVRSKSTPGEQATPASFSIRVQNATLSFERSPISANR